MIFLCIFTLSLVGAIIHAPNNYDYLTYRLPRLLHWQHQGGWHWISTANERMNYSGADAEWLLAPLFFFTGSDRLLFLPNIICFALLPAATYVVFCGVGISKRTAWFAMWTVPTAYCYVAQAGGTGNDLLSTGFFLFSIALALRAKATGRASWLFLAALAMALCTGVKSTNLPLLLPWILIAIPAAYACTNISVAKAISISFFCAVVSIAPIAVASAFFTQGQAIGGGNDEKLRAGTFYGGLIGNSLALAIASLQPPILPFAGPLNANISRALPENVTKVLGRDFPRLKLKFGELPNEESAGLGFGITLLAMATIGSAAFSRRARRQRMNNLGWILVFSAFAALVVYMGIAASESAARLLSPYYPAIMGVPFALASAADMDRRTWWRMLCLFCAASAIPIPLLTPSRPLIPAAALATRLPLSESLKKRVKDVYSAYSTRSDNLGAFRQVLPNEAHRIGIIATGDDIEVSLWRPFGSGKSVHHVNPERISREDSDALLISSLALRQCHRIEPEAFLSDLDRSSAWEVAGSLEIVSKVHEGPVKWTLLLREDLPKRETSEPETPLSRPAK